MFTARLLLVFRTVPGIAGYTRLFDSSTYLFTWVGIWRDKCSVPECTTRKMMKASITQLCLKLLLGFRGFMQEVKHLTTVHKD